MDMHSVQVTYHAQQVSVWNHKKITFYLYQFLLNCSTSNIGIFGYIDIM